MGIKWVVALLCVLAGSVAVPIGVGAEPDGDAMAGPPELGVAVVVNGRTLELRRFIERMVTRTTTSGLPPGVKIEVKTGIIEPASSTDVFPVVETHIMQIDATKVVARRIDGRVVSFKVLMDELAKPTPVVLAKQGRQVAPLFLKMFKPESLILLFPSSTPPTTVVPDYMAPANRCPNPSAFDNQHEGKPNPKQ